LHGNKRKISDNTCTCATGVSVRVERGAAYRIKLAEMPDEALLAASFVLKGKHKQKGICRKL
jgi:hypothetical protein